MYLLDDGSDNFKKINFTCEDNAKRSDKYKYTYLYWSSNASLYKALNKLVDEEKYPSFKSTFDSFVNRITRQYEKIYKIIHEEYLALFLDNSNNLNNLDIDTEYTYDNQRLSSYYKKNVSNEEIFGIPYENKDLSKYDNKYCIYWY
jgi:hypothetical protein